MSYRIFLTSDAETDLESNARWYGYQETHLSARFKAEVYGTLHRIARYPFAYLRVDNITHRALMNRFRYYIYFTCLASRVIVLAIIHQRRAETVWLERKDCINRGDP
jgi:plasmid stabilization system protein ParE